MIQGYVNSAMEKGTRFYQEDRFSVIRHETQKEKGWLLAVMDGHGGAEVARYCEENIESKFKPLISDPQLMITDVLRQLIEVFVKETRGMDAGSTISLVYISETSERAFVAILGDSLVIVKNAHGLWISPEHNIRVNQADKKIVLSKGAFSDGYYMSASKLGQGLQLTRSLGDASFDRFLIREPEIFSCFNLNKDSFIIVASDGLLDPSHNDRNVESLRNIVEKGGTAYDLVNDAIRRKTGDNVTAVLWKQPRE